jgi:hypothetical protein
VETSRAFLRDSTAVSPYALLLFGGALQVLHDRSLVVVDRWIAFRATPAVGVLFRLVREELDAVLLRRVAEGPDDDDTVDGIGGDDGDAVSGAREGDEKGRCAGGESAGEGSAGGGSRGKRIGHDGLAAEDTRARAAIDGTVRLLALTDEMANRGGDPDAMPEDVA